MNFEEAREQSIAYGMSDLDGYCRMKLHEVSRRMVGEIPPYPPSHLATVARFVHVLAYRVFNVEKHPDAVEGWEPYTGEGYARGKYIDYVIAVLRLNDAIDAAAKAGSIKLNDRVSGTALVEWRMPKKDAAAKLQAALVWERDDRLAAETLQNWPIWYPHIDDSIVVEPKRFLEWIESENIASPGETLALLEALKASKWVRCAYSGFPPAIEPLQPAPGLIDSTAALPVAIEGRPIKHKLRANTLDAPILKAIKAAESEVLAAVYLALREMALNQEQPFTGTTDGDALCYTTDDNKTAKLTKNALRKRIQNLVPVSR